MLRFLGARRSSFRSSRSSFFFLSAVSLALGLGAAACSSSSDNSPLLRPNPDPKPDAAPDQNTAAKARQACLDLGDAVAKAAVRCSVSTYQEMFDVYTSNFGTGCSKVVAISDETSLRKTCIPSFQTIPCADFTAPKWSPSCEKQLQMPAGALGTSSFDPNGTEDPSSDNLKSLIDDLATSPR